MEKSMGFIGGGRITRIILHAFKNKKVPLENVAVSEIDASVAENLKNTIEEISLTADEEAASQNIVFLALHPPVIMEMLEKIKPNVTEETVIISLAPKITIDKIAARLVKTTKIVRLIPNATSYINDGYNPVSFSSTFSEAEKKQILEILLLLGKTFEVDEEKLEAYAIISAMAPTYFWFQWETLRAIGEEIGLDKDQSCKTVHQTLKAALDLQFESGLTNQEVLDLIPVKPICDYESDIKQIFNEKLIGLHNKIKP